MKLSMEYKRLREPGMTLQWVYPPIEPYDHLVVVRFVRHSEESYVSVVQKLRKWCAGNFGRRGDRITRQWKYSGPSNFGFRSADQAMMFMTFWNGYSE